MRTNKEQINEVLEIITIYSPVIWKIRDLFLLHRVPSKEGEVILSYIAGMSLQLRHKGTVVLSNEQREHIIVALGAGVALARMDQSSGDTNNG